MFLVLMLLFHELNLLSSVGYCLFLIIVRLGELFYHVDMYIFVFCNKPSK